MKKVREYQRGRDDGLLLAIKIVKEGGVEALEQEIKYRNLTGFHTNLTMKELDDAGEMYRQNAVDTVLNLAVETNHDLFGHGTERLQRFVDRFRFKASCLGSHVKWKEIQEENIKKFKLKNVTIANLDELDSIWGSRDVR